MRELQRTAGNAAAGTALSGRPRAEGGRPLEAAVRREMESRFAADFSGVRVHDDREGADAAADAQALAFTIGPHITFAAGQYDPHGHRGRALLAHELAHVVQQSRGGNGAPGEAAERDATRASAASARGAPAIVSQATGVGMARQPAPAQAPAAKKSRRTWAAIELLRRARQLSLDGNDARAQEILERIQKDFLDDVVTDAKMQAMLSGLNGLSQTAARMMVTGAVGAIKRLRAEYRIGPKPSRGRWDVEVSAFAAAREYLEVLSGDGPLSEAKNVQAYDKGSTKFLTAIAIASVALIGVAGIAELGAAALTYAGSEAAVATGARLWVLAVENEVLLTLVAEMAVGVAISIKETGTASLNPLDLIMIYFNARGVRYRAGGRVRSAGGGTAQVEIVEAPRPVPGGAAPPANDNATPLPPAKSNVIPLPPKAAPVPLESHQPLPLPKAAGGYDQPPTVAGPPSKKSAPAAPPLQPPPVTTPKQPAAKATGAAPSTTPPKSAAPGKSAAPSAAAPSPKKPTSIGKLPPPGGPGTWLHTIGAGQNMSEAAGAYQEKVTGAPRDVGYFIDGVEFDGYKGGTLLDAKHYTDTGQFVVNEYYRVFIKGESLYHQALSQVRVAKGARIEWHVPSAQAKQMLDQMMTVNKIPITVVVTP